MAARVVKCSNSTALLEERSLTLEAQYHQSVPSLILIAASRTKRDTSGSNHAQIDRCQTAGTKAFGRPAAAPGARCPTMPLIESVQRGRYGRDCVQSNVTNINCSREDLSNG